MSLIHWGQEKMAVILQKTFSNVFSWIKIYEFWLISHWSLFPMVQLTIFQHWFRQWLDAGQVTHHYLNRWWLVYSRIYASLCLNELDLSSTPQGYELMYIQKAGQHSFNPLCAKFCRGNKNIYLHFMSSLHIDMTQVVTLLPQVRPGPTYSP